MIPKVDKTFVKNLELWVNAAENDEEKAIRQKGLETILFGGADDEEVQRINAILAEGAPTESTKPKKRPPVKLYDPQRRGYMRSTNEEGIGEELRLMRAEASGTPFFDGDRSYAEPTPLDRLRGYMRSPSAVPPALPAKK